ncbi:MAG: phospholipid carrier-dependent glycosyltransferase [Verrucomicrobiota bacterium]|nr:phospholipid carrier-dependent glycosyltransferase [Verrucomicrobiota bacterium]
METFDPPPEVSRPHAKDSIFWWVVVALAALLRLGPIASGLPYSDYVDEGHILHPAIQILKSGKLDPGFSTYPPLTSYLTVVASKAYAPFYRLFHHHKLRKDLPADQDLRNDIGEFYDFVTPPDIIVVGRLVVAGLSIGTVILAGALAKLLGGSRTGFVAMLFTALSPALVTRGSIVIIDPVATFVVLATLYFCQRLRVLDASNNKAMARFAVLAGITSGLACAAKYTVGIVFAAVLVTILTLALAKKSKAILILFASAGLFVGIFCGAPGVVLHFGKIVEELRGLASFYQTIQSDQGYWRAALSESEIGIPLMVTGLAGIGWMVWNVATRNTANSWIAFAVLLLSAVVWSSFQPFRNLLSLVPPLCIAAALLCHWLGRFTKSWLAGVVILLIVLSLGWSSARHLQLRTQHIDTRVRTIEWLQQHATKNETVLGIRELSILPAEWKRIAAKATVVPWFEAAPRLEQQRFDYVVIGDFDLRYVGDPKAWSAYRDVWLAKVSPMPVEAEFGQVVTPVVPYLWRTNDERVLILRGNSTK